MRPNIWMLLMLILPPALHGTSQAQETPPLTTLMNNQALVGYQHEKNGNVIQVIDLTTGTLSDLPVVLKNCSQPVIGENRNTLYYWNNKGLSQYILGKQPSVVYRAEVGKFISSMAWWSARKSMLLGISSMVDPWPNNSKLVIVPFAQPPSVVTAVLQQEPPLNITPFDMLCGMPDGKNVLVSSLCMVRQPGNVASTNDTPALRQLRARIDMETGKGVTFADEWEKTIEYIGGGPLKVTNLRLSPDQNRLYLSYDLGNPYSYKVGEEANFFTAVCKQLGIYSCKPDGTDLQKVLVPLPPGSEKKWIIPKLLDVSPDGKQLLVSFFEKGTYGAPLMFSLWTVDIDGKNLRQVPCPALQLNRVAWFK